MKNCLKTRLSLISCSIFFFLNLFPDCVPKAQCKPMQNYTKLEPGMKIVNDNTGCCPVSKLVCDKSTCPSKPPQCSEAFYVMEKTITASDKICCDIFECREYQAKAFHAFLCRLSINKHFSITLHRTAAKQLHCNN